MVGKKPTGPIDKIHERQKIITLCNLQLQIVGRLRKVGNVKSSLYSHASYILSKEAFTLFSSKEWKDPEKVGKYYKIPVTVTTATEQRTKESKWKVKKEKQFFSRT